MINQKRPLAITLLCIFQCFWIGFATIILSLAILSPQKMGFIFNWWTSLTTGSNTPNMIEFINQGKLIFLSTFVIGNLISTLLIYSLWNMKRWAFLIYIVCSGLGTIYPIIIMSFGKPASIFNLAFSAICLAILLVNLNRFKKIA